MVNTSLILLKISLVVSLEVYKKGFAIVGLEADVLLGCCKEVPCFDVEW